MRKGQETSFFKDTEKGHIIDVALFLVVILDVHIQLREWELNSMLRKLVVDLFVQVELQRPVVF